MATGFRVLVALTVSVMVYDISGQRIRAAQVQEPSTGTRRFDVASVKPHRAADDVMFAPQFHDGGRFTVTSTLRMLIRTDSTPLRSIPTGRRSSRRSGSS